MLGKVGKIVRPPRAFGRMSVRQQYLIFLALGLAAFAAAGLLLGSGNDFFRPYFGNVYPLLVFVLATIAGLAALAFLRSKDWIIFDVENCLKGLVLSAIVAALFAIPVILVDIVLGYPRNINVPLPHALLFYPAIGYVAEIVFHVLPLALLLLVAGVLPYRLSSGGLVWLCIVLVSAVEPAFQLVFAQSERNLTGVDFYTGVHVYAISFAQLYIFRRYDFVAMYAFRIVYYLCWHILWGYVRLQVLF